MADRFPLIANSSANQIQELASGDRLDLTGTDVVNLKAAGVVTATTFVGAVTGDVTGNVTGNATGLSGTPDITVRNITGVGMTLTGVLTYEDVTNVDSVGIVTARAGIAVLGAGVTVAGVGTFHNGLNTEDLLREEVNVVANKLSAANNIYVEDGMVHLFTTAESTTSTPNIKYNAGTDLNDKMSIGQSIVVTVITTANAAGYSANLTIDGGSNRTVRWIGGSAPSGGGSSGVDIHTYTIIKTADDTFTIIGNHSKTS